MAAEDEQRKARARAAEASGSDDEAPEEFSKDRATEQALRRLQQEQEARQQAADSAAAKRKRKTRTQEEPTRGDDDEVAELPADVLSAVAAQQETDAAEQDAARERTRKRNAALKRKQTHVRQFGSVQVRTLASAEAEAASRALSSEAEAFLARRAAPHRERMSVLEGHPSLFTRKQKQRAAERA